MTWDDEAPRGFQEADLELEEFEAQAAREYSSNELDRGIDEREAALYESMDQLDEVCADCGDSGHRTAGWGLCSDVEDVEEREPYMTAAELRFEAELDEMSSYEDYLGLNDY